MPRKRPIPDDEDLEKERKAVELRRAGMSYPEIAERLGYTNRSGAYKALQRALSRVAAADVDAYRALEEDRLDRLQLAYWPLAMRGDVAAGRLIVRIMQQRARMLGLNAPVVTQLDLRAHDNLDADIEELLNQLARLDPEREETAPPPSA